MVSYFLLLNMYLSMIIDGICGLSTLGLWCPELSIHGIRYYLDSKTRK